MRRLALLCGALILSAGCSAPPQREIDLAQGAIDAARAAGAEQYARAPFDAATTALQQAHEAVAQRDYRFALSRALDAGEQAREAAKLAADGKARARSETEASIAATTQALRQLHGRIKAAEAARVPATELATARRTASDAEAALQEARAAVAEGRYLEAGAAVRPRSAEITAQIAALNASITARQARPARRRR